MSIAGVRDALDGLKMEIKALTEELGEPSREVRLNLDHELEKLEHELDDFDSDIDRLVDRGRDVADAAERLQ